MHRIAFWSSLTLPSVAVVWGAWFGTFPLGVRGQWEWLRIAPDGSLGLSLIPPFVAAALYIGFVWLGQRRHPPVRNTGNFGLVVRIGGRRFHLAVGRAGKRPQELRSFESGMGPLLSRFIGILSRGARDAAQNLPAYLSRYEEKMAEGDVLHIGTHPGPGRHFWGLLSLCERSGGLVDFVVATEPDSVGEAFDELRRRRFVRRTLSRASTRPSCGSPHCSCKLEQR